MFTFPQKLQTFASSAGVRAFNWRERHFASLDSRRSQAGMFRISGGITLASSCFLHRTPNCKRLPADDVLINNNRATFYIYGSSCDVSKVLASLSSRTCRVALQNHKLPASLYKQTHTHTHRLASLQALCGKSLSLSFSSFLVLLKGNKIMIFY